MYYSHRLICSEAKQIQNEFCCGRINEHADSAISCSSLVKHNCECMVDDIILTETGSSLLSSFTSASLRLVFNVYLSILCLADYVSVLTYLVSKTAKKIKEAKW